MSVCYRLRKKTLAVIHKNGQPELLTLPEGTMLTVKRPPSKETGKTLVELGDRTMEVFTVDLERRGEALD